MLSYTDNEAISSTKVLNYLGLQIDDTLKWTHTIAYGIGIMYIIKQERTCMSINRSQEFKLLLYLST